MISQPVQTSSSSNADVDAYATWQKRSKEPQFAQYDELRQSKVDAGLTKEDALQVTLRQWKEDEANAAQASEAKS